MAQKIPATVITGFLGAGKTTMIRHLLQNAGGRRIALIVNEFGDVGVDGELLKGCGDATCPDDDVIELANGCICCTVADDFIPTMKRLIDRPNPPEHIIIETSGLALPQPLVRAFGWPDIRTRVTIDGVITVADGPAIAAGRFAHDESAVDAQRAADDGLDHETPLSELFEDQISCADLVVLNKTDLLDAAGLAAAEAEIRHDLRPGARIVHADHGKLGADVLLGLGVGAENDAENRKSHHDHEGHDHDHDDFESFVVARAEIADPAAFAAQCADVIRQHDVLRLKGFIAVTGKPMRMVIQAVGPRIETYFDRPWRADETRETRLVVIGLHDGLDEDAIGAALRA